MIDCRGVSVTLDYIILLAVATGMLVAMLLTVGGLVDSQLDRAVEDELTVTGHALATELEQADQLYRSTENNASQLEIERRLPSHVSGHSYRLTVNGSSEHVTLWTTSPEVSVTVDYQAPSVAAGGDTVPGGPVRIALHDGTLEVTSA